VAWTRARVIYYFIIFISSTLRCAQPVAARSPSIANDESVDFVVGSILSESESFVRA
jgi:hypothetical protein